jgi:hypothetical protein
MDCQTRKELRFAWNNPHREYGSDYLACQVLLPGYQTLVHDYSPGDSDSRLEHIPAKHVDEIEEEFALAAMRG